MPDEVAEIPFLGPTSVSLDEMEQQANQPTPPKLDEIKVDGTDIPEDLRGKSVADVIKLAGNLANALKLSENARTNAETMARMASQQPSAPPAPVAAPEPKELSREEISELYATDPIKAIEVMQNQAISKVAKQYEVRLEPLFSGTSNVAEQMAKTRYAEVFEILGPEIDAVIKEIGGRERLTSAKSWDDVVSYVRGQPKNFDKLVERRMAANGKSAADAARGAEDQAVGFQPPPQRRTPMGMVGTMDPTKHQIAVEMEMSDEEYLRWEKVQ